MDSLKILLAEDDLLNQIVIQKLVQDAGFELEVVNDGQSVIEKLRENTYDLILMDIEMPIMNGYEATTYIRNELGSKSNIPIIVITSLDGIGEAAKCMLIGANTFIQKPLKAEELIAEINTLVI